MATMLNPNAIPDGSITSSKIEPSVLASISERVRYADVVDGLDSTETDNPLSANQGRVLKAGLTELESEVSNNIERNIADILGGAGEYHLTEDMFAIGDVDITTSGWTYHFSENYQKRVVIKQGITLPLHKGDVISLLDYNGYRFYLGWRRSDGTYGRAGWNTADYIVTEDADYIINLAENPDATQTSIDNLFNLLTISYNAQDGRLSIIDDKVEKIEKDLYVIGIEGEIGGWNIKNTGWIKDTDSCRVRTNPIKLQIGDKIVISDYTKCRYYVGWMTGDGVYHTSGGWLTSDFVVAENGIYVMSLEGIPRFTLSSADDLLKYASIHYPNKIANMEEDIDYLFSVIPQGKGTDGYYQGETLKPKQPYHTELTTLSISSNPFADDRILGNQGCDNDGDIFFFARNGELRTDSSDQKIAIVVVDARDKTKVGEFVVNSPISKTHGNNLNVGAKYNEADTYPLLYVSVTYTDYRCLVIRPNNSADEYSLVQTIMYSGTKFIDSPNSVDWLVDLENNTIYAYGSYFSNSRKIVKFAKFNLPLATSGDVTFGDADIIEWFEVDNCRIAQGAKVIGNRIFIGLGYEPGNEWLKAIDINSHKIVTTLKLEYEPEGVQLWNDKVSVTGSGFTIRTYEDS